MQILHSSDWLRPSGKLRRCALAGGFNNIKRTLEMETMADDQYLKTSRTYSFTESHFHKVPCHLKLFLWNSCCVTFHVTSCNTRIFKIVRQDKQFFKNGQLSKFFADINFCGWLILKYSADIDVCGKGKKTRNHEIYYPRKFDIHLNL